MQCDLVSLADGLVMMRKNETKKKGRVKKKCVAGWIYFILSPDQKKTSIFNIYMYNLQNAFN